MSAINFIKKILLTKGSKQKQTIYLSNDGYCLACGQDVTFISRDEWLRDHYKCSNCNSIPRERALMMVLERYFPDWREKVIHESSPSHSGASKRISEECKNYIPSQFFPGHTLGSNVNDERCENLENLTFADESIDIHISQDVMEHVFNPTKAFSEIARTLKPGGAHIFTVPMVNKNKPSCRRAEIDTDGNIIYLEKAVYHDNPISGNGSLVTYDWGYDICNSIYDSCHLFTHIVHIDDPGKGIRAEFNEVLVTMKPG